MEEISGGLIIKDGKVLMRKDDGKWTIPKTSGKQGELGSEAARRAARQKTGCQVETYKYRGSLKVQYEESGEEHVFQPFELEINEGSPEGEWKDISELGESDLEEPLPKIKEKIQEIC
jgi:8-oxo-dGTP pyrophosphatase MutT (NUDIX family)